MELIQQYEYVSFAERADLYRFIRRYSACSLKTNQKYLCCRSCSTTFSIKRNGKYGFYYTVDGEHRCERTFQEAELCRYQYGIRNLKAYLKAVYLSNGLRGAYKELVTFFGEPLESIRVRVTKTLNHHCKDLKFVPTCSNVKLRLSNSKVFRFLHTPTTPCVMVQDLRALLLEYAKKAKRQEDHFSFENTTLREVIRIAYQGKEFPSMHDTPGGFKLITSKDYFAEPREMNKEALLKLLPKVIKGFKTDEESVFNVETVNIKKETISEYFGFGNLSTAFTRDELLRKKRSRSGGMIRQVCSSYFETMKDLETSGQVKIDRIFYIYKLGHYVTSYHVDDHAENPLMSVYQQLSGYSVFHFLPVLIGKYLQYVSKHKSVDFMAKQLRELDSLRIGSLMVLHPGETALILPTGSHAVYVPDPSLIPEVKLFSTSIVRAADFNVLSVIKDFISS